MAKEVLRASGATRGGHSLHLETTMREISELEMLDDERRPRTSSSGPAELAGMGSHLRE